ncbi:hypothetical protein [Pseudooceanicola sp. LIPI14-2-Ac024]|uniref:hypothetical protein n=1 Tax=Pseudooceanicola sp. LIPI14-2-Ac024 TaxID=3344875 RepID=UPI0035D025D5
MSDPVTNVQIEDVLSSIRKLVSEEVRAQTRPRAVETVAKQPEASDKLILTPALRVPGDDASGSAEAEYGGADASEDLSFDIDAFSRELDEDAADEADAGDDDLIEGAGDADDAVAEAAPLDLARFARAVEATDDSAEDEAEGADAPEQMIPSFLRSRGRTLSDRIVDVPQVEEVEATAWEDHDAADSDVWAEAGTPEAEDQGDAPLLDEEMLRDMVAEIVRQELQGALGERITRNVRKLVRREIQRALTAHDLL